MNEYFFKLIFEDGSNGECRIIEDNVNIAFVKVANLSVKPLAQIDLREVARMQEAPVPEAIRRRRTKGHHRDR